VQNPQLVADASAASGPVHRRGDRRATRQASDPKAGWRSTRTASDPYGLDAIDWARRVAELGAGEILLTSMDRDGTRQGSIWS